MKTLFSKLSELKILLLIAGGISALSLIAFLVVGLLTNYYGWLIGGLIGTLTEFFSLLLLYRGTGFVIKMKRPYMFLFFFFARMMLYVVALLACAMFGFQNSFLGLHFIPAFEYSIWGCLIIITPVQIITMIVYGILKNKMNEEEVIDA